MKQAEDRVHRIGQTSSVNITYLVFADSIDSFVAQKLAQKREMIHKVLNYDGSQDHMSEAVDNANRAVATQSALAELLKEEQDAEVALVLKKARSVYLSCLVLLASIFGRIHIPFTAVIVLFVVRQDIDNIIFRRQEKQDYILTFGKYQGLGISMVYKCYPSYYKWLKGVAQGELAQQKMNAVKAPEWCEKIIAYDDKVQSRS